MRSFDGKVILVTGASSGIGEALARSFAARRASLVLAARRVEKLQLLATELETKGVKVLVAACDVDQDGEVEKVVEAARDRFGRLDVVIANAGFGVAGAIERLKVSDYRRQFETNVFGVLRTIYASLSELKKSQGQLVLIGSVAGYVALPGSSPYSMSKFAIRALADAITPELRKVGVSVTLISPGFVDSNIRRVDNQGVLHADIKDPIPGWVRVPTEQAAEEIVRAVEGRRRERIVTGHGKAIVFAFRHFPGLIRAVVGRGLRGRPEPQSGSGH